MFDIFNSENRNHCSDANLLLTLEEKEFASEMLAKSWKNVSSVLYK